MHTKRSVARNGLVDLIEAGGITSYDAAGAAKK